MIAAPISVTTANEAEPSPRARARKHASSWLIALRIRLYTHRTCEMAPPPSICGKWNSLLRNQPPFRYLAGWSQLSVSRAAHVPLRLSLSFLFHRAQFLTRCRRRRRAEKRCLRASSLAARDARNFSAINWVIAAAATAFSPLFILAGFQLSVT